MPPKTPLDKGQGKAAVDVVLKPGLQIPGQPHLIQQAEKNPVQGEAGVKMSSEKMECQPLGDTSAQGPATNPRASFTQKILAALPRPSCQEQLCSEPSSHTVFSKLPLTPHLFQETFKPEYPLPTLDLLCLVWFVFFFFLPSSPVPLEYNHSRAGSTHLFGT